MTSTPTGTDCLLAFDTSTERMAVALALGGRSLTQDLPGGAAASAALLPTVQALLAQAGATLQQVSAIGFGRGPGAFTGLRTSCAVAQGLAFGLGCPVLPLDSLLIVAEQARVHAGPGAAVDVGVVVDARMGEAYAARYCFSGDDWRVNDPPALWQPQALDRAWGASPPALCAGSGLGVFGNALRTACPLPARVDVGDDRAAALLALARRAWHRAEAVAAEQALPLYLRDKVALTTAERAAAQAAQAVLGR